MSQVRFLRGTQSSLTTLLTKLENNQATVNEGSFYLTSDTGRLYYAKDTTHLLDLNQFIRTVATQSALPETATVGDYYYITADNILCVKTASGWTQINPDTNTRLSASEDGLTASESNGTVSLNLSVQDTGVTNTATGQTQQNSISTVSGSVDIIGGDNVNVSVANGDITIDATDTTYDIQTAETTQTMGTGESGVDIQLDSTKNGDDSAITLKGTNGIAVSQNSNVITLNGSGLGISDVDASFAGSGAQAGTNTGVLKVGVNGTYSSGITPTVAFGQDSNQQTTATATFTGGTTAAPQLTLPVYTATQVDNKINNALSGLDALKYEGVINDDTNLTNSALWGTVYKAGADIVSIGAKTGDLIIAEKTTGSTADQEGTSGHTTWVVIPSGDDQTIEFEVERISGDLTGVVSVTDGTINGTAGSKVQGDATSHTEVTYSESGGILTTTVKQKDDYTARTTIQGSSADVTQTAKNSQTFTAVTGVKNDVYGNITDVITKTLTVVDTHNAISDVSTTVAADNVNGGVIISTNVADNDNTIGHTDTITIASGNSCLTVAPKASDSHGIMINLEWESFDTPSGQ